MEKIYERRNRMQNMYELYKHFRVILGNLWSEEGMDIK